MSDPVPPASNDVIPRLDAMAVEQYNMLVERMAAICEGKNLHDKAAEFRGLKDNPDALAAGMAHKTPYEKVEIVEALARLNKSPEADLESYILLYLNAPAIFIAKNGMLLALQNFAQAVERHAGQPGMREQAEAFWSKEGNQRVLTRGISIDEIEAANRESVPAGLSWMYNLAMASSSTHYPGETRPPGVGKHDPDAPPGPPTAVNRIGRNAFGPGDMVNSDTVSYRGSR